MFTELLLAAVLLGAYYPSASAPVYVARLGADGYAVGFAAPTRALATYSSKPLTVNCRALNEGLLPVGECYVFGWVVDVGGVEGSKDDPAYFELSDGWWRGVCCYPSYRCRLELGQFVRARLMVDGKGRGTTDEVVILGFRSVDHG